jgi:hypothetical protein
MSIPEDQSAIRALVPLLDEALLSLREKDREALMLRFYERQGFRAVGASLGVGEDAAQKRVAGALEKLATFFQRRGYKAATAAIGAAALQHTAVSAPAAFAEAMAQGALAASPPALAGWAAHPAGLGKVQAASICAAVLVAPVAWQWYGLQSTKDEAAQARAKLETTRQSLAANQADMERMQAESRWMSNAIAASKQAQSRSDEAARQLEELKERLRGLLAASSSRWPDDLPYVRVPRSAVDNVTAGNNAIDPSGKLDDVVAQLLGLTPQERTFTEAHLAEYYQKVSDLASRRAYETNSDLVQDGWVAKTIVVPPLGAEREQLWSTIMDPVMSMLGHPRRNQLSSFWMMSIGSGGFYPWTYDDRELKTPSAAKYTLSIKPDGTDAPAYSLLHVGNRVQTGKFPIQGTLPGFLRERFEPWIRGLGINNIETGQP